MNLDMYKQIFYLSLEESSLYELYLELVQDNETSGVLV